MVNDIEFTLRMNDMVSGMWPKITATAQRAFDQIEANAEKTFTQIDRSISRTQKNIAQLSRPVKINVDTSAISKAQSMLAKIQSGKAAAPGTGSGEKKEGGMDGLSGLIGSTPQGAMLKAGMKVLEFAGEGIQSAMKAGMQQKSLEIMLGANRGREVNQQLGDLKKGSSLDDGVYKNAQTLTGAGVGSNDLMKVMHQLGEVAMGDQDRMNALSAAFAHTNTEGKLMEKDLQDYTNAGFNPLSVMAEKWQQFGLKAGVTVEQLKNMMAGGKISSAQVGKAFELATAKGGQYYQAMEAMSQTSGGKMAHLTASWDEFKTNVGNALMPVADATIEAANGVMGWMDMSKTVPETLMGEKSEINALVDSISHLNEGNTVRARMIDMLKQKYPDQFSKIDVEKIKNSELLDILQRVNGEYDKRIKNASTQLLADKKKEDLENLTGLVARAQAEATGLRRDGKRLGILSIADQGRMVASGLDNPFHLKLVDELEEFVKNAQPRLKQLQMEQQDSEQGVKNMQTDNFLDEANTLYGNNKMQKDLWGPDYKKNHALLEKEMKDLQQLDKTDNTMAVLNGNWTGMTDTRYGHNFDGLDKLVHYQKQIPAVNTPGGGRSGALTEAGGEITGGGKKQITISIKSFAENFNVYADNIKDGGAQAKEVMERYFLQILQSANAAM